VKIAVEYPPHIEYSPTIVKHGAAHCAIQTANALRRAGVDVTLVVPSGSFTYPNTTALPVVGWPTHFYDATIDADVVIWNSPVRPWLRQFPNLLPRLLIVDHYGNDYVPLPLRQTLTDAGATFVATTPSSTYPCLVNQILPVDRAPLVNHDPKLLITVSRLSLIKRLPIAVEVMQQLKPYGYHGIVFTDRTGLDYDDVRIDVPHAEVMRWMAKSACLLHPALREVNGSCAVFEAAAHGVPVMHTMEQADYFLEPSGTSVKVGEPLVDSMVQAVLNLIPPDRQRVRQWFDDHYSEQQFVQRLLPWIDRVMSQHKYVT
jgi:glycosyltransferase involved in cell wall biosynthesis